MTEETRTVQVLLYGDQTVEKLPVIRAVYQHARSSPLVQRFLRDACDIVQIELSRLRPDERANVRNFDNLLALAEDNARLEEPSEIVATILMGVARLAEMLFSSEKDPSILTSNDPPTHILGLCTGEIAAAIPAGARDTTELYSLSVEAVGIFCRFARDIIRRSRSVDPCNATWATTIVGKSATAVQKILNDFHESNSIPSTSHISIGFVAQGWVTLFGPPTVTQRLFEWSKTLDEAARVPTDARGGVHLPNLPKLNVDEVVGPSLLLDAPVIHPIWSPYDCRQRSNGTVRELLHEIINDCTQRPMQLSDTIKAVAEHLEPYTNARVTVAGQTPHLPTLGKAFSARGILCDEADAAQQDDVHLPGTRGGSEKFAIIGQAGRFPGSESVAAYWQSLLDGERFIREIPKERFDLDKWYDKTAKQKNATVNRSGAFLDRPGAFDNRLFNLSPREAFQADPLHRLFLTVCYEALENAGYSPDSTPSTQSNRIATYFGQTSDDWRDLLLTKGVDIYYAPGICRAFGPSRVHYHFKWGGGSYAVDSACASSITAISLACSALKARECDTAVVGGGSILNSPAPFAGLSRGGFLSPERGCETYHEEADGYVRGEGVGCVIVKRLEDALTENDNIIGVIAGSSKNYSSDATSISHPSPQAQQRLYRQVLHEAGVEASSIGYVEMHGTGTQAGDAAEMKSVVDTFSNGRKQDLIVGAVKANIGHGEAAAGICALIKANMILKDGRIPPQPGQPFQVNKRLPDLSRAHTQIAAKDMVLKPSAEGDGKRRIFLNSFDASGGNSCLLLEEPPTKLEKGEDPREHHVVVLSARTPKSLIGIKERYLDHMQQNGDVRISDLAYSTTARRMHHSLRSAFVVSDTSELIKQLETSLGDTDPKTSKKPGQVVFAFTGQGSQYSGMGRQLWQSSKQFRQLIETYQGLVTALNLPSFTHLIEQEDVDMATADPVCVQLAIVAVEMAVARLWISFGIQPSMVIGHSLGEYAALCIAGVLTVSDTLALVGRRAQMITEHVTANEAAMLAIPKPADEVKSILSSSFPSCEVSCLNAPQSTVVSGSVDDLDKLKAHLQDQKTRSSLLRVPYAFHSAQLDPVLDKYETFASGVNFMLPEIPVASTLLGRLASKGEAEAFSANYLRCQMREPVNFVGALQATKEADIARAGTVFLETGPDPVCLGLVRANLATSIPDIQMLPTIRREEDNWKTISGSLAALYEAGHSPNWPEFHRDFVDCLSLLDLPTYAFDEKDFWEPYPDPDAAEAAPVKQIQQSKAAVPGFPTSSLQRLISESVESGHVSAVFESNTADENLLAAIQGHAVAGVKIVSSSIFSDMALSATRYAHERLAPGGSQSAITISRLDLHHPVVVMERDPTQVVEVKVDLAKNATARVSFRTKTGNKAFQDVGSCEITRTENNDLFRQRLLIDSRIEALHSAAETGDGHKLQRRVIYQLFNGLVEYGKNFQGLEEVHMDEALRDAVGRVRLPPPTTESGSFLYSPYLLDVIVHLAGFLANCGLKYGSDIAFLSTGFDTWSLLRPLSATAVYTSYASLVESPDGSTLVGDVYVLEGENLVSVLSGLRFSKMKKAALNRILLGAAPAQKTAPTQKAPRPAPQVTHSADSSESPSSAGSSEPGSGASTPASSAPDLDGTSLKETFLDAVASEAQVDPSELQPDTAFADLGLDSLMAITVIASLRNQTGVELPGSFFLDNETVAAATGALPEDETSAKTVAKAADVLKDTETSGEQTSDEQDESDSPSEEVNGETPQSQKDVPFRDESAPSPIADNAPEAVPEATTPSARALLLHGSASPRDTPPLFLLPDLAGTIGAFCQLAPLADSRRMYGIESPFARQDPSAITELGVSGLAKAFAQSIRVTQPDGPYLLAGCSMGATLAFEVARVLLESGCAVQGLLLAGPAPSKVPTQLSGSNLSVEQIEESGLLGDSKTGIKSAQQKAHALALVQALLRHEPRPLTPGPQKVAVAAPVNGLSSERGTGALSADPGSFLHWARSKWSSKALGWEDLVAVAQTQSVESDYWSMMTYPKIGDFSRLIEGSIL